jgi:multiple sugar transport system substrate-binding protein
MSGEKVSRRAVLGTVAGLIVGGAVGAAVGWLAKPAAVETVTSTVRETVTRTETVTQTVTQTVTGPVTTTPPPATTPPPVTTPPPKTTTPTVVPPEKWQEWYVEAAKPWKGITIAWQGENTPMCLGYNEYIRPKFEEVTGIKIEPELIGWSEGHAKQIADVQAGTGVYDIFFQEQDLINMMIERKWVIDLTDFMEKNPHIVDPNYDWDDVSWYVAPWKDPKTGHLYGIVMEEHPYNSWYRYDLYEKLGIKDMPKYWDEFYEISKKFFEWGKTQSPRVYGAGCQMLPVPFTYLWQEGYWSGWGVYCWGINMWAERWRASVENGGWLNSDRSVQAWEYFFKLMEFFPPEAPTFSWGGNSDAMAAGRTPHGFREYAEFPTWIYFKAREAGQHVPFKSRWAIAAPWVWEETEKRGKPKREDKSVESWLKRYRAYHSYMNGGGWSIPWCAPHKEAALLWGQFSTNKVNSWFAASIGDPYRISHHKALMGSTEGINDKDTEYYSNWWEYDYIYAPAPPFPFHVLIAERVNQKWILKILNKEVGIKEGLDAQAKEVDEYLTLLEY